MYTPHCDIGVPLQVIPCREVDMLFCLHDNGSTSARIRRQSNVVDKGAYLLFLENNRKVYFMCIKVLLDKNMFW